MDKQVCPSLMCGSLVSHICMEQRIGSQVEKEKEKIRRDRGHISMQAGQEKMALRILPGECVGGKAGGLVS